MTQEFIPIIYEVVNTFPRTEEFGLKSQIKRACLSIALNIAEGHSRKIGKEQANFYRYAYGSLMEVVAGLSVANKLGFLPKEKLEELKEESHNLARLISGLKRSTLERSSDR